MPVCSKVVKITVKRSPINQVNFCITTRCNLNCFDCCCDIPRLKDTWDADIHYLINAAEKMRGKVDWIQITGGEPLMNPQIDDLVPIIRGLFKVRMLTMETNGFLVIEHEQTMQYLDEFYVTEYDALTFSQSEDCGINNSIQIDAIKQIFGSKCKTIHPVHIPRSDRPNKGICGRGLSGVVSYWKGYVYPCCVGPGIENPTKIELTDDWKEQIYETNPDCDKCWFACG